MKKLTAILTIGLFSCGQTTTRDQKVNSDSTHNESKSVSGKTSIDSQLKGYLDTAFNGWTLPAANRWDTVWFNQYNNDGNLVNYVKGDFDCNKETDHAVIFKRGDGNLVAYTFLSSDKSFKKFELFDFGKDTTRLIDYGLELISPGKIKYMDPESDDVPFVLAKCNAVQVLSFEKGAETFYWDKGKLKSVPTGD
jgi:hypothetical protein